MESIKPDEPLGRHYPTRVFDPFNAPGRVLKVRVVIDGLVNCHDGLLRGEKQAAARALAETILKEKGYWEVSEGPTHSIEINGSVVVMTEEELQRYAVDQYHKGRESAKFY
jgi:hypothetical protein